MMHLGAPWTAVGFCLLSACVWGQDLENENKNFEFEVHISGTEVTLICPETASEEVAWKKNDIPINGVDTNTLTLKDSETEYSGHFHCKRKMSEDREGYYLYLKTRVCDGCVEVEVLTVVGIVIADVFITLGVLLLVYYWSKRRKAKAKPVGRGGGAGGRTRGANKERPPPVPNPDYEPIRKGQRDVYAGLNQRAI